MHKQLETHFHDAAEALKLAFDAHSAQETPSAELYGQINEYAGKYFRSFDEDVWEKVSAVTNLYEFSPYAPINFTAPNTASKVDGVGRDYFFVVDGTVEAVDSKQTSLGIVKANEDSERLYFDAEIFQDSSGEPMHLLAGRCGAVLLRLAFSDVAKLRPRNVGSTYDEPRVGSAELSRRIQLLRTCPLFSQWKNKKLGKMSMSLRKVVLNPFQKLGSEGDRFKECFIVAQGEIRLRGERKDAQKGTEEFYKCKSAHPSTTLAVLGRGHLGGVVELVDAHKNGCAAHRCSFAGGHTGATIYTISLYFADIFFLSAPRQWNILVALRRRRLLWENMRFDMQQNHSGVNIRLTDSSMMVNFGYVLNLSVVAFLKEGNKVIDKCGFGETVFGEEEKVLSEYQLTLHSARALRRTGEALIRNHEHLSAISSFSLASKIFRSTLDLIPHNIGDDRRRLAAQNATRLANMSESFANLATFCIQQKHAMETIHACKLQFSRKNYNAATKNFVKAHDVWKEFLKLYEEDNSQYVVLNKEHKRVNGLVTILLSEMSALTKRAHVVRQKTSTQSVQKLQKQQLKDSNRLASTQPLVRKCQFPVSPPPSAISPETQNTQLLKTMKRYGVRKDGHVPARPRENRSPPLRQDSPRLLRQKRIMTYNDMTDSSADHNHPDAVHHITTPKTTRKTSKSKTKSMISILQPKVGLQNKYRRATGGGGGPGIKHKTEMNILLIEPSEQMSKQACALFPNQGKRYGYICNVEVALNGIAALNKLYPVKHAPKNDENTPESELLPARIEKRYNVVIVSASIMDVSWRSIVEKVRRRGNARFIYVTGEFQNDYHSAAMAKDVMRYGGNGIYPRPYNKTVVSNILMNVEKYSRGPGTSCNKRKKK